MFVSTAFAQAATESQPEVLPVEQNGTVNQNGLDNGATQGGEIVHTEIGVAQDTGASGVFPPFDSTHYASQLLWLAITFGLFYLFMSRVVLPRIGGVIETRRDRIAQDLEQAARLKTDADNSIAAYEQELAEARRNAAVIGQEARDQGKAQIETERAAVEASLEAKLAEAEGRIAAIKTKAMAELGVIAQDTASEIVEKLLGEKPEDAELTAAVKAVSA